MHSQREGLNQGVPPGVRMKKHRGRWLASGGVGLIVIAIVAASLASLQSRNSIYPILVQPCVGEVALRLHNSNLFWTVSYRLLVETGQYAAAQRNGSLAAGDN